MTTPEVIRLQAILACEQGRVGHAPEGWTPQGGLLRNWGKDYGEGWAANVASTRNGDARWEIFRRGIINAEHALHIADYGVAPDKLAAMEAADEAWIKYNTMGKP